MDFKDKQALIEFIARQVGVVLENDEKCALNQRPDLLYAEIPRQSRNRVLSLLDQYGVQTNQHLNGKYWIYLNNKEE